MIRYKTFDNSRIVRAFSRSNQISIFWHSWEIFYNSLISVLSAWYKQKQETNIRHRHTSIFFKSPTSGLSAENVSTDPALNFSLPIKSRSIFSDTACVPMKTTYTLACVSCSSLSPVLIRTVYGMAEQIKEDNNNTIKIQKTYPLREIKWDSFYWSFPLNRIIDSG